MIRVGFALNVSSAWMGGLNYFKNLLYAIRSQDDRQIEPVIFLGRKVDASIRQQFSAYGTVIETSLLDQGSPAWWLQKIGCRLFRRDIFDLLLRRHRIDVLSHASLPFCRACRKIEWIPDFQHVHLPQLFQPQEIAMRNRNFARMTEHAACVVLSSQDAIRDFSAMFPDASDKARLLHFVSQPDGRYTSLTDADRQPLMQKYGINGPYFYLPNQFWKHKNHEIAFAAVQILSQQGVDVTLVCTGHMEDYRSQGHVAELQAYIRDNNLQEHIMLLGLVPYADVFALIRFSLAVVNPSLFEGWSSTVEECKSVGKGMILSDIDVHREQFPQAFFFARHNAGDLARAMQEVLSQGESAGSAQAGDLRARTQAFARTYETIVMGCLQGGRDAHVE